MGDQALTVTKSTELKAPGSSDLPYRFINRLKALPFVEAIYLYGSRARGDHSPRSDIIICDLTGQRPNVFVEAGYALKHHENNRLIFLFEPRNRNDKVPFDLTTFKYVPISQAAEIPNTIKSEIIAILQDAGAPL